MSTEYITEFRAKTGRLPSQVELSKALSISPQAAVTELLRYVKEPYPEKVKAEYSPDFLAVGLFIVASITFVLSIYFTALWFSSMFSLWLAGSLSVAMVGYMVLSPQVAQGVRGITKLPLWGSFVIALIFSMGSTVAGQYNRLTANVDVAAVADRAVLDLYRVQERELLNSVQVDRDQQAFHQATLEALTSTAEDRIENQAYAATERNKVIELGNAITEKEEKLAEVRQNILEEIQGQNIGVTVERQDFYSWLAGLLGIPRDRMEFLIAALPAIFIDIIAALSLNLALRRL